MSGLGRLEEERDREGEARGDDERALVAFVGVPRKVDRVGVEVREFAEVL